VQSQQLHQVTQKLATGMGEEKKRKRHYKGKVAKQILTGPYESPSTNLFMYSKKKELKT
jgi:hypothetical protein